MRRLMDPMKMVVSYVDIDRSSVQNNDLPTV